jgi:tetratricopeptide (TPR) repeat protein
MRVDYKKAAENYEKAIGASLRVLELDSDNLSALHFLINAYDGLCAISNAQGDREKADEYDKKAEEYRERGNDTL